MGRYKSGMSAALFDRTWPYVVPIDAEMARSRNEIAAMADDLGAAPERPNIVFGDRWHRCFCFNTPEAAKAFADTYGAEVKDARKRINKGTWQIWEEAKSPIKKGS